MAPVKERVAQHRAKVNADPIKREELLQKERERDKKRRSDSKITMSRKSSVAQSLLKQKRLNDQQRQRKCRLRLKEKDQAPPDMLTTPTAYKCPQSLGKAKSRIRKALPYSPRKRLQVATEILLEEMPSAIHLLQKISDRSPKTSMQLDEGTVMNVKEFYCSDSVSRQEPGKRDVVSVKDTETKKRSLMQKRIMLMTMNEAFSLFIEEYPSTHIKTSKFFELRPKHVLPMASMPHNVCVCKYHANMDFLVRAVHDKVSSSPRNGADLINALVCSSESEACMSSACDNCNDEDGECLEALLDAVDPCICISWKLWSDVEGRPQIVTKKGSVGIALEEILRQITQYKLHVYVKRAQAKQFDLEKSNLETGVAVLQMDFAENYSMIAQDEIQSAHWSHGQVTIFTAVAWLAGDTKRSFAVVSDDLLHGKVSVFVFMKTLINELKKEFPDLCHVKIFTDGCAAQFKNKYTLSNLIYMEEDFGISGEWSFFASSHGKGAVDGVGGCLKRNVWLKIKARQLVINTAEEFAACARDTVKNVNVIYVTAEEVASAKEFLNSRWETVLPIPRLQSIHHIVKGNRNGDLNIAFTNISKPRTVLVQPPAVSSDVEGDEDVVCESVCAGSSDMPETEIEPGSFVLVTLTVAGKAKGTRQYYAEVLEIDIEDDQTVLKYMAPSGKNFWVWPEEEDISTETMSLISMKKVNAPKIVNNRGQFKF